MIIPEPILDSEQKKQVMKHSILFILISGLTFIGNNLMAGSKTYLACMTVKTETIRKTKDKDEIQKLIRQALTWANSKNTIDLLPVISDSIYIGFDSKILNMNLKKLEETKLFAKEFIDNYNQIILTLDKNIKGKVYDDWFVGDLPTFGFANDVNPWCDCQEIPDDKPNPWDLVEITVVNLDQDKGELTWTWGKSDWEDLMYKFRVVKEDGKWKISYMEGFDYNEGIKED